MRYLFKTNWNFFFSLILCKLNGIQFCILQYFYWNNYMNVHNYLPLKKKKIFCLNYLKKLLSKCLFNRILWVFFRVILWQFVNGLFKVYYWSILTTGVNCPPTCRWRHQVLGHEIIHKKKKKKLRLRACVPRATFVRYCRPQVALFSDSQTSVYISCRCYEVVSFWVTVLKS